MKKLLYWNGRMSTAEHQPEPHARVASRQQSQCRLPSAAANSPKWQSPVRNWQLSILRLGFPLDFGFLV
jgi:hypothetical protein